MLNGLLDRWLRLAFWARAAIGGAAGWTAISAAGVLDRQLADLMPRPPLGSALRGLTMDPFIGAAVGLAYGVVWNRAWPRRRRTQRLVAGLAAGAAGSFAMAAVVELRSLGQAALWLVGAWLLFGLLIAAIAPGPRAGRSWRE